VPDVYVGISDGKIWLNGERLLCSYIFDSPNQKLMASSDVPLLNLNIGGMVWSFMIEKYLSLQGLIDWISDQFEVRDSMMELQTSDQKQLPKDWIAIPVPNTPIEIKIVINGAVKHKVHLVARDESSAVSTFVLDVGAKVSDLIAQLVREKAGKYRFWAGFREIWIDLNEPLCTAVMPMDPIVFDYVPFAPVPLPVLRAPTPVFLEISLILPPDDRIEMVSFPRTATVADAITEAKSRIESYNSLYQLIVRDIDETVLDENSRLIDMPSKDIFFSAILEIPVIDRAVNPHRRFVVELSPDITFTSLFPGRKIANQYGIIITSYDIDSLTETPPFILVRPHGAIAITVLFANATSKQYVVDGDTLVGSFLRALFPGAPGRINDENGIVTRDLFLKSLTGQIFCTDELELEPIDFLCPFCLGEQLFHLLLGIDDSIARVREIIGQRCEVVDENLIFTHAGYTLNNDVVLSKLTVNEADPVIVSGLMVEVQKQLCEKDLLVSQLARVSHHPIDLCRRLFIASECDYDAALIRLQHA
jgi:hypothetical protein